MVITYSMIWIRNRMITCNSVHVLVLSSDRFVKQEYVEQSEECSTGVRNMNLPFQFWKWQISLDDKMRSLSLRSRNYGVQMEYLVYDYFYHLFSIDCNNTDYYSYGVLS
jgi:hypothetical protein